MRINDKRTGKSFDVPDAMGEGLLKTARGRYQRADLEAQPEVPVSQRTGKPKRGYKRRDMRAEKP